MEEITRNQWYLDTRCNNQMTCVKEAFPTLDETFKVKVKIGDDSKLSTMGKGQVRVQTEGNEIQTIFDVLYVPCLKTNSLSIGQL